MEDITIKNNHIQWPIQKGVDASIPLGKADGWIQYDEILADIKPTASLTTDPMIRLSVGSGLTITGNDLIITITNANSRGWFENKLYMDVKLKLNGKVLPAIFIDIILTDTVTDI